ncbi:MAG: prephenate dehydratase [PVC group bacterium]
MDRKDIQKKIAGLDEKVLHLLNRRGRLARQAGGAAGKKETAGYNPAGEEKVLRKVIRQNTGPLENSSVRAVYREILSVCRKLSGPVRVAYLGPEPTFTHAAARKQFGAAAVFIPAESVGGVFQEAETGAADYGVVPIENSLEGAVTSTLDMLLDSPLQVCSEVFPRVSHCLLSTAALSRIERVYSHPSVFGQCRRFLQKNLPRAELREAASTARAAEIAAAEKRSAALAGSLSASIYGLKIVRRNVEDSASNITRFLVIGKTAPLPTGRDRTSVLFSLPHRAGSLHDALNAFKKRGINLTKIESRPSRKKAWEYYFFVDLEGHRRSKKVREALEELERNSTFMKLLGSYPAGQV